MTRGRAFAFALKKSADLAPRAAPCLCGVGELQRMAGVGQGGVGELDCPVCFDLPEGVVHQCFEGHCFCAECDASIEPRLCPICRDELPERPIRNRSHEARIAALCATCEHCGAVTTRGEKAAHELGCAQRPRACAGAEVGCKWSGLLADQPAHEATCAFVVCQRMMAPMRAQLSELMPLQAAVPALQVENERLRKRVAALEADAESGYRQMRQRVHLDRPDPAPTDVVIEEMSVTEAVAALRAHVAKASVAASLLERLEDLCTEEVNRQPAVNAGVLETAVVAAKAHKEQPRVQVRVFALLRSVCWGSGIAARARKQRAVQACAIESIVAACFNINGRRHEAGQDAGRVLIVDHWNVFHSALYALRVIYGFRNSDAETIQRKAKAKASVMILLRRVAAFQYTRMDPRFDVDGYDAIRNVANELMTWLR